MSSPEELFSKQLTINIELMRELVETKDKLIEQIHLNTRLLNEISANEKSLSKKDITHKFTDEHFRQLVQDLVGHETLYQEDIEDIKRLEIHNSGCKEFNGLEYFTGLEELCIRRSELLTSLTIPELPRLKYLEVWSNSSLTSLTIPERFKSIENIGCNHPDIKIEWV